MCKVIILLDFGSLFKEPQIYEGFCWELLWQISTQLKDHPREAGARGIVFYPRGNIVESFAWGLGNKTNNEE